ncbi:competence protein ComEC [Pseudoalteromonas denitrificans DSM 6059]|uniref:Competence protein ComEC n=1 Tax=Pseudoalteromonas denitrificans DSM 6059 TaxID=1123010 RepID=A0A1I1NG35_9GAMM|nr:competence protein ComEC [Pseudoalteromonas denitrificans DSM 6059]
MSLFLFNTPVFFVIFSSILLISLFFKHVRIFTCSFVFAIVYLVVYYHLFYSWELPQYQRGISYQIKGEVIKVWKQNSSNNDSNSPIYFKFRLDELNNKKVSQSAYINLSWYHSTFKINKGDKLRANAKLKPYRSLQNIGNRNSELWSFYAKVKAKGYIDNKYPIALYKTKNQSLYDKTYLYISTIFYETEHSWFYKTLLLGDKSDIPDNIRAQFKFAGISHLLAISGLHIGMIFGIGFYLLKLSIYLLPIHIKQEINLNIYSSIFGLLIAAIYTGISGCAISAIRALIMLCTFIFLYIKGKQYLSITALQYALLISLILNPFQLLNPGIYFSYTAVIIIIYAYKKINLPISNFVFKFLWLVLMQCILTLGLLPLVWFFFDGISFIGIVINLIAIPLMAIYILPTILLILFVSLFLDPTILLVFFDQSLSYIFNFISQLNVSFFWILLGNLSWQSLILIYLSLLFLITQLRGFVYLPIIIIFLNKLTDIEPVWMIDILDVGHGLSILISQNRQSYIYDLGAKYLSGTSIANKHIKPFIEGENLRIIHTMISHKDADHAGGLEDWIKLGYKNTLLIDLDDKLQVKKCTLGEMQFGSLSVNNIWPYNDSGVSNNNSCVVKISDDHFSVLIPGDIHKDVEHKLIKLGINLKSTILISPHHGSKTSSSSEFIEAVSPDWVIHSSAFYGRWLMPHPEVISRYEHKKVQQLTTGISGHIRIKVFKDQYTIETARKRHSYWFLVK